MSIKIKNLFFLLKNLFKLSKSIFIVIIIKNIFKIAVSFSNILGIGIVINALEKGKSKEHIFYIILLYVIINIGVTIIRELIQLLENFIMRKLSNEMQYEYSNDSLKINYHYVQDNTILQMRRKSMQGHPAGVFVDTISNFTYYLLHLVCLISIFSYYSPLFIFAILITSFISIIFVFINKKNSFNFANDKIDEDRQLDYLYTVMTDYKYSKDIRVNNAEGYIYNKYNNIFKTQIRKIKNLFVKNICVNSFSTIISVVQTVIMYLYFTYEVVIGNILLSEYTILISSTTLMISTLLGLFEYIAILRNTATSAGFYKEYKELIKKNSNIYNSNILDVDLKNIDDYCIEFKNVSFSYPKGSDFSLKNISLKINNKEKIGIVGLNGSGKTTFIKLLTRLYDPLEGEILLNGINIKEIPYMEYIKKIGIVLQDYSLFAYSIKENIAFDNDADDEQILEVLEMSGLSEKVKTLPKGIDTSIYKTLDNSGIEFSGGEGQKLAFSRALFKHTKLIILDEPTSAMDPISEYEFFKEINKIADDQTCIFISHRLSSTKKCDRIIVFDNGEIVEQGNHNQLMKNKNLYYKLFSSQAKFYIEKGIVVDE